MFGPNHYVPVLKWRQGEYLALKRSSAAVKDQVTPLLEIPLEPWDFEAEAPAKTLDQHLEKFGKRLSDNWGDRRCFIDSPFLDGNETMEDDTHHLVRVFELARAFDTTAVPTTGLDRSVAYQQAVGEIAAEDERGICLRLHPEDLETNPRSRIRRLLAELQVSVDEADLVIDYGAGLATNPIRQTRMWADDLAALPYLQGWRSLTVAGGSMPASFSPSAKFRPFGEVPRTEWQAYKRLRGRELQRVPTFGDYGASAPRTESLDPRMIDPNAKIKYSLDDVWRVTLGTQVKRNGREQYQSLAAELIRRLGGDFRGAAFSWGDKFIADCASGAGNGGSSTWPCSAHNQHFAVVRAQLATLHGP